MSTNLIFHSLLSLPGFEVCLSDKWQALLCYGVCQWWRGVYFKYIFCGLVHVHQFEYTGSFKVRIQHCPWQLVGFQLWWFHTTNSLWRTNRDQHARAHTDRGHKDILHVCSVNGLIHHHLGRMLFTKWSWPLVVWNRKVSAFIIWAYILVSMHIIRHTLKPWLISETRCVCPEFDLTPISQAPWIWYSMPLWVFHKIV